MKTIEGLVIGLGVGLLTIDGAHAADLPVKASAIEYMKVCSLYGPGFYYVPGTDTCMKLGGYMRIDTTFNGSTLFEGPSWSGNAGQANRLRDQIISLARQDINIDTRTATDYGVLRTYFEGTFQVVEQADTAGLGLPKAFIQFAGFTFGRALSQFDAPWSGYPGNASYLLGGYDQITGVDQVAYTAQFGEGVTGSVSLEGQAAPTLRSQLANTSTETAALYATGVLGAADYGGLAAPDIIGQLRVDQAWGLFQVSVAAHDIHASYYSTTEISGHPEDTWGWAAQLALSIKNIPTGKGDTINLSAGYANGASRYIVGGLTGSSFAMYGGSSLGGAYQSIAFGGLADGVFSELS